MPFKINNLFSKAPEPEPAAPQAPQPAQAQDPAPAINYKHLGVQAAGQCGANEHSLSTRLYALYYALREEQKDDFELQQESKKKAEEETLIKEVDLAQLKTRLADQDKIEEELQEEKQRILDDIDALKTGDARPTSRKGKFLFWFVLPVIVMLTLYLFVFYSSTIYSAFFKDYSNVDFATGVSIFDSQALSKSLSAGFMQLVFVLIMPSVFLALGIVLYLTSWKKAKKAATRTAISTLLYIGALAFDIILALLISNNIYDVKVLNGLLPEGNFGMMDALSDKYFWAVIFGGFIAYLVWGLLFGHFVDLFDAIDAVRSQNDVLENKLERQKQAIDQHRAGVQSINEKIVALEKIIAHRKSATIQSIYYDNDTIKLEINDYFSGWISFMELSGMSTDAKKRAAAIKDAFVGTIGNEKIEIA